MARIDLRRYVKFLWAASCVLLLLLASPALAQTGNPTHDALSARSDLERRQAFLQGLRGSGNQCNSVARVFAAGLDAARSAYWDIRCADGTAYRVHLPAERFSPVGFLRCGAAAPAPRGGPCFQPVSADAASLGTGAQTSQACEASCARQPAAAQSLCVQRCVGGTGVRVGTQVADALPPGTRFGAFYRTDNPLAAYGFANGLTDRLGVNMQAVRACQSLAGPVPCKFHGELVNQCGALAFAVSRHPQAMAMTSDISTQILNLATTAAGATQQAAEASALQACRRAASAGVECRIVASGC